MERMVGREVGRLDGVLIVGRARYRSHHRVQVLAFDLDNLCGNSDAAEVRLVLASGAVQARRRLPAVHDLEPLGGADREDTAALGGYAYPLGCGNNAVVVCTE